MPAIVFEFQALEFLKGEETDSLLVEASFGDLDGSSSLIYGVYESERDAIAEALYYISVRDESWDEREAILFLNWDQYRGYESYSFTLSGSVQAAEYRLESLYNRVWLPAADVNSQSTERFLMTAPAVDPGSESAPWRIARESITLAELRYAIAELDASISRAKAEGIPRYRECLVAKYERERRNQQAIYQGGELLRHSWRHYAPPPPERRVLFGGLPAERTVLDETRVLTASYYGPEFRDRFWLDGPDAHLFELRLDTAARHIAGTRSYLIVASSVLPVGSYRFQLHNQEAHFRPCGYYDELSATDYFVEVITPEESRRPIPRYANCVMGNLGVLGPGSGHRSFSFRIDSSSECGSTQRNGSGSHYEVFEMRERVEVEATLSHVCPSLRLFVHEGIGPTQQPLHSLGTDDLLRDGVVHPARFAVLPPGTYTFELNVPASGECYSTLYYSWYPEQR